MTNNRVSMFRQAEVLRDPDHPKICARCQLVWKEYQPARDPHCHCFDHEYADFDREFGDFWRRKSDKEVAQLSEPEYRHQWFCGGHEPCACMDSWKAGGWKKAIDYERPDRERIASLERTIGEQADQIGGLVSELERVTAQRDDIAEAGIRDVKGMGVLLDKVKQKLTESQAREAALRQIVEREIFSNLTPEDTWIQIGKRGLNAMRAALATPSAAAERVQALEEVAKAAQKWLAPLSSSLTDSEMAEAIVKQNDALRDAVVALAALDAAIEKKGQR